MANVTFTANNQPAPACYPSDVNGLLHLIAAGGLTGTVPDNAGGGIYVGSSPPSSALTNKVWFKTDGAGRPLGVFMFYNGNWRLVYTGSYGDIKMFSGNPSGLFDGTGRGIINSMQDGWALCNGNNGTPNLTNRFIVGGYGFDGVGWVTNVDGTAEHWGGQGQFYITSSMLPQMGVTAFGVRIAAAGNAVLAVGAPPDTPAANWPVMSGGVPVGGTQPVNNCPPYYALAYAMFVGYQ